MSNWKEKAWLLNCCERQEIALLVEYDIINLKVEYTYKVKLHV